MMTAHPSTATTIVVFCRLSLEEEEEEGSTITAVNYGMSAVFDLACPISRFLAVIICLC
jgi:hypothetical protein